MTYLGKRKFFMHFCQIIMIVWDMNVMINQKRFGFSVGLLLAGLLLNACSPATLQAVQSASTQSSSTPANQPTSTQPGSTPPNRPASSQSGSTPANRPASTQPGSTPSSQPASTSTPCHGIDCQNIQATPSSTRSPVPVFSHVMIILLENTEYNRVVGNTTQMPNINQWIQKFTLLTQYYAVTHPSLPNYLALMGGSTFGIRSDCNTCFVNAPSLAQQLTDSHRSWKTYQEDMPSPCYLGDIGNYNQKHNPFIYFDSIRNDKTLCTQNVVPLTQLDQDLVNGSLPDFAFITPNLCNDAHNCTLDVADQWLAGIVSKIMDSKLYDSHSLIVITFDEGDTNASCCGLGPQAGGHIATLLISPLVKMGFEDNTPYSHYSLLKTIETSWDLPWLGHAADAQTNLMVAPWQK
jgi:hypothetical protein